MGWAVPPDSLHTRLPVSMSVTQRLAGQVTEMHPHSFLGPWPQEGLGGAGLVSPVGIGQGRLQASREFPSVETLILNQATCNKMW